MGKLIRILRETFPGRPRRYWRYVSPRRHGVGMLLLALVLTATYGYWFFTNDVRIRRSAERYLSKATGWQVSIRRARFTLFGGLELQDVRAYLPGSKTEHPFLEASHVQMSHSPLRLLTGGGMEPTEIVCLSPVVTFEKEQLAYQGGAKDLLIAGQGASPRRLEKLIPIRLREGKLQVVQSQPETMPEGGSSSRVIQSIPALSMSLLPRGEEFYEITFEDRTQKVMRYGAVTVNVRTGETVGRATGYIPSLLGLWSMLPPEQQKWLEGYSISGGDFEVFARSGGSDDHFEVKLMDLAMTLPEDQGGFRLKGVTGSIVFRPDEIEVRELVGRLDQAPNARLSLKGSYKGYEKDSPYSLSLEIRDLDLPTESPIAGKVGEALKKFLVDYQASGRLTMGVTLARKGERTDISGWAQPEGMALTYKHFPYPVSDVRGRIEFHDNRVYLKEVTARHGQSRISLRGEMEWIEGKQTYDIHIDGRQVELDEELAQAVPRSFEFVWKTIRPGGRTDAKVRVRRGPADKQDIIDLELRPDGHASMRHAVFPYPVENIAGLVRIADNVATIEGVSGGRGPMRFTINGVIRDVHRKDCTVEVDIDIRDMPLDGTLQEALVGTVLKTYKSLHPTGRAQSAKVKLRQGEGKAMTYDITAALAGVSLCYDAFPYPITDVSGQLEVQTDVFRLRNLAGRNGQAEITAEVLAQPAGEALGIELEASGRGVLLDKALYEAIPPAARRVWDMLAPAGRSDLHLKLRSDMPGQEPGLIDYRLVLHPQDMRVMYTGFPYPFNQVRGEVVIAPGRTELKGMTAGAGDMSLWLDGLVLTDQEDERVELALKARNVPVDATLREAMPADVQAVLKFFHNAGQLDLDLPSLRLSQVPSATTRPSGSPATSAPASRPGDALWSLKGGTITVRKARLDLDDTPRELSGKITGSAARRREGLELSADISVDHLSMLQRRLEKIQGKLTKQAASPLLRVDNLLASAPGGGRMAGFAEILFIEPMQYGLSLYVEDMPLAQLFPPPPKGAAKGEPPQGMVTGNIQMTGSANQPRQALGTLRLSKAKLYKLPVLLGLLSSVYLSLPGDTAFTDGHIHYHLKDNLLIFDEIYLTGQALSLVGSGQMNTKTEKIRLTFLTGPPGRIPRLRSLADELVTIIHKELMEIEVVGNINRPVTRTVPLRSVDAFIRRVMQPEGKD